MLKKPETPSETDPIDRLCQIRDTIRVVWMAILSEEDSGNMRAVAEVVNEAANNLHAVIERLVDQAFKAGKK